MQFVIIMSFKKWIWIGAALILLVAAACLFIKPTPPPLIKLPNPNGYDDLVKAGEMFVGDLPECYWKNLDDECLKETRVFLNANSEALKLVRLGLSRESRVPIVYTPTYFTQNLPELASMKRLAQILNAEGNVDEKENRMDDAIQSYLDAVRLHGQMRGGAIINELVGIAVEFIGVSSLLKLSDKMTVEQRGQVIKSLATAYENRDSYDEVMAIEKKFVKAHGLREQFTYYATFHLRRAAERRFQTKIKYSRARVGLTMVDLALRNFVSDNSRSPNELHELVPKYLPFLPKDDFSEKDFVYRPSTNGYELYGVGADGEDDGGKPFVKKGIESPGDMLPGTRY